MAAPFASRFGGEVTLDLVMVRGSKHVHRVFELLRGLVEDNGVQHDVVQVVRDISDEWFQVRLRVVIMLLHGDSFINFAYCRSSVLRVRVSADSGGQCVCGVGEDRGTLF